jgi:hypothetical protein
LDRSSIREFVTAIAAALILSVLVSWAAVYGLNRYLGPYDDPTETTGTVRTWHKSD